tara:strand:- start:5078 stop:5257 length:180 start_codon:yes stop_codon:yes gene_type:complete
MVAHNPKPYNARFEASCLSKSVQVKSFRLEKGAPANATFDKKGGSKKLRCQPIYFANIG